MSAQNENKMPWVGEYTVLQCNDYVSQITDGARFTDWVHNSHLQIITARKEEFEIDSCEDLVQVHVYEKPIVPVAVLKSEGGEKPTVVKAVKKAPAKAPVKAPVQPTRVSSRLRKAPDRLQCDGNKIQTYAQMARAPAVMHVRCPSPNSQYKSRAKSGHSYP